MTNSRWYTNCVVASYIFLAVMSKYSPTQEQHLMRSFFGLKFGVEEPRTFIQTAERPRDSE